MAGTANFKPTAAGAADVLGALTYFGFLAHFSRQLPVL